MRKTKLILLAGISGLALQLSAPAAFAADMAIKARPLPQAPSGTWTWWIEGGGVDLSGDPFVPGFNAPPFDIRADQWGWQGAGGVDYRFAGSDWHVSADFRFMGNGSNAATSAEVASFAPGPVLNAVTGANSANRKESAWEADFMVGRDLQIGNPAQVKFGLRVADIWGQTNGAANWAYAVITPPPLTGAYTFSDAYRQTNKWIGAGPRLAIEGVVPLQGAWSIDYNGGVAALFGHGSATQTTTITTTNTAAPPVTPTCLSGCPIAASTGSNAVVFNADAQVGIAYALSNNARVSLNYRVDGYWNGMRGFNAAGAGVNLSRVYSGPTLKLTVAY